MKELNPIFCCQIADNTKRIFEYLVYFFILLWFRIVDKNSVHQKVNRNIDLVTS